MSRQRFPGGGTAKRNFEKGACVNMAWRLVNMMAKSRADNPSNLPAIYDAAKAEFAAYTAGMKTMRNVPMKTGYGYDDGYRAANNINMNAQVNSAAAKVRPNNLLLTGK